MDPAPVKRRAVDRRVQRTWDALRAALFDLIVEKGYDRTTVQDILDRADVGRSTFYAHFFNKQDLLLRRMSVFQLEVEDSGRVDRGPAGSGRTVCEGAGREGVAGDGAGREPAPPDVTPIFAHIADQYDVITALRGTAGFGAAMGVARDDLTRSLERYFRGRRPGAGDVPADVRSDARRPATAVPTDPRFLATFFTGALLNLMTWWIDAGMPETPKTMNRWFGQLVEKVIAPAVTQADR